MDLESQVPIELLLHMSREKIAVELSAIPPRCVGHDSITMPFDCGKREKTHKYAEPMQCSCWFLKAQERTLPPLPMTWSYTHTFANANTQVVSVREPESIVKAKRMIK